MKNKMKNKIYKFLFTLCLGMLFAVGIPTQSQGAKYKHFNVSAKVEGENKVKLKWKKQPVVKYEIYRADVASGSLKTGTYKWIATISGKKTSFTDKTVRKDKRYSYKIKGYKNKNGKITYYYNPDVSAYTGLAKPEWFEYAHCDTETTGESIPLKFEMKENSFHPDGVVFYKKTSGKYKKIKSIKLKKNQYTANYTDRNVNFGKKYFYKMRTYRIEKGKKVYSKYSQPLKLCAINNKGDYTLHTFTQAELNVDSIIVSLTSNKGNGVLTFDLENLWMETDADNELCLSAYSLDNTNWVTTGKKVSLKEGETIYLRFTDNEGTPFYFAKDLAVRMEADYSGYHYLCDLEFATNTVTVWRNGEYYH
ncbi:MAG: hypothetical protein PUC12_02490 [Clostridiales bacterium]|nr:hypothetical protein [Clostridiales bacterium]